MEHFLFRCQGKSMNREEDEGGVVWMGARNGSFSVKALYYVNFSVKALYYVLNLNFAIHFSLGIIWNLWIPSKVSFFA